MIHAIEIQLLQSTRNIYRVGDEVTGEIIVRPPLDWGVQSLDYYLRMVVHGKGQTGEKVILRKNVIKSEQMRKGEEYRYPIRFTAPLQETYIGKNTSFKWRLETAIELDQTSEIAIKRLLLKQMNLLKLVNPYQGLNNFVELTIHSRSYRYKAKEQGLVFKMRPSMSLALFGGVLLIGIFIGFRKNIWLIIGGILSLLLLYVLIYHLFARLLLKHIHLNVDSQDNELLFASIQIDKNWDSIREMAVAYSVREVVNKQDEEDLKNYDELIFRSEEKKIKSPNEFTKIPFLLPENDALGSCKLGNAKVYWEVNLTIRTKLGFKYQYYREIQVEKEYHFT